MDVEVTQAISTFISKNILKQPNRSLAPETRLISAGLIDSFRLIDLVLFVEDTFGVTIQDTELDGKAFDTIGELADLIETRRGN